VRKEKKKKKPQGKNIMSDLLRRVAIINTVDPVREGSSGGGRESIVGRIRETGRFKPGVKQCKSH